MHLSDLSTIDRRIRNDVRQNSLKELMLATPHIIELVKADDANLIDNLMHCYLSMYGIASLQRYQYMMDFYNAAQPSEKPWSAQSHFDTLKAIVPNPSDLKDTYWHLLKKINNEAVKHNARNVILWSIEQLKNPAYPYFAERQSEARMNRRNKIFYSAWNNTDKRPLPRPSREDLDYDAQRILTHAIHHADSEMAMSVLPLVKRKRRMSKAQQDDLRFHERLDIPQHYQENPTAYIDDIQTLLTDIDERLGTQSSFKNFMRSKFIAALGHDDSRLRDYFISYLTKELSSAEKKDLVQSRDLEYETGDDSTFGWRSKHIFFNVRRDILDRFLDVIDDWGEDKRLKSGSYRQIFFTFVEEGLGRGFYASGKDEDKFSSYDVSHNFHGHLKWAEITNRLNLIRRAFPSKYKPITIRSKHYFSIALERAAQLGHTDDFAMLVQAAQNMDGAQGKTKLSRNSKKYNRYAKPYMELIRWQIYRGVARSPEMLQHVNAYLEQRYETLPFMSRDDRLLDKLCRLESREDRERENGCHYKKDGVEIAKEERAIVVPEMMETLKIALKALRYKKHKRELLQDIFGEDKASKSRNADDYTPLADTLRVIKNAKDMNAVMAITRFWFEYARPLYRTKSACQVIEGKIAEAAFDIWHSHDEAQPIVDFIEMARSYDEEAAKQMANQSGRGSMFGFGDQWQALKIIKLFPELVPEDEKEHLERPTIQGIFQHFDKYEANRIKWREAQMQVPDTKEAPRHPPTNFDQEIYERLLPAMQHYKSLENGGDAQYHAMKLAILFPTINKASKYLNNHAHGKSPVHDACLFILPQEGQWDKELWANLAVRWGNGALRWLPFAPKLEAAVAKMNEGKHRRDHFKLSECRPSDLRRLAHEHCSYEQKAQNPQLAEMLFDNGVPEKYFEESLELTKEFEKAAQQGAKVDRDVPTITIDGKDIGHAGYQLNTLPAGDPRNLWMGQFVNSCMHIASEGRNLALAMFQEPHAASYVVQRKSDNEIVASFHTWMSKAGNIVLNTWQPKTSDHDFLRDAFVRAAGEQALAAHPTAQRVVMGQGRIPEAQLPYEYLEGSQFFQDKVVENGGELNKNGEHYTFDTIMGQFVIAQRDHVKNKRTKLAPK